MKSSDVEANDLSGGHLQLLIHTSLQVLIQQGLQLLVLLVQETGLLDEVLALNKHLVVLAQGLVEVAPHGQLLGAEHGL